ncbi:MAG TPA: glucoamylase family protein [Vicinamibacterales bacterium]|nr:glucoamylase family protein [Vicinamibacterales bacterium]
MPEALTPTDVPAELATSEPAPPELFNQEQLEAHAARLAAEHRLAPDPHRGRPLLPRLDEAARQLEGAYRALSGAGRADTQPVGSEDWLRDNHHVVRDQVREIRQDLPGEYYRELPKLADGPFEGYPRVYVLARELIAHTAGRFDLPMLQDFATAYQRNAPLLIGEIWAIPIMLRLALVEELQRLAEDVVAARKSRDQARRWGATLGETEEEPAKVIDRLLKEEIRANGRLSAPFVIELLHWLRDQPSSAAPAWSALQRALEAQGDSAEAMLHAEHQRRAADQLAIGNIITSMRLLSSIDWPLFFEHVSLVEQILREDPAGAYALMDFATRDRYRHSIEELAKGARKLETDVARRAVELARASQQAVPENDRSHHVGYFLISRGRFRLEEAVGYPPSITQRVARFNFKHQALGYLGTMATALAVTIASLLAYAHRHGGTPMDLVLVALVALIPASELIVSLLNLIVTLQVKPRPLPRFDLRTGIPARDRTMVVVPAIVGSEERLVMLLDEMEVRFFANRDPHLHFALLTDFEDGDSRQLPGDQALLEAARRGVDQLNARHGPDRFFLFHRDRQWNPRENRWMGRERKRGKLAEFNRLLRGATDTSFVVQYGELSILRSVRYVITLDSDTQLPMEAARKLVGTLSHPLNRPRFDPRLQRVTEGYGVLQPRIDVSVVSANRSAFARIFSGHVGVDPYTTAVSDVYQDLFHEGSYVGKGIYDVDAFDAALAGRVPENRLLSHDLFEGVYARTGLCTDISLVDDYPSHYLSFAARQHRWIRGDWQIARWLWRTVPDASGRRVPNTLPVIARWKILDNLRRSLLAPSLLILLLAGWTVLPGSAMLWTMLALLVLAFPAYVQVARSLGSVAPGVRWREHLRAERDNIVVSLRQSFLSTALLAHQSVVAVDAIARTLVRLAITRRRLLEWVTADRREQPPASPAIVFRRMWQAPALAAAFVAVVAVDPLRLVIAAPIAALWFLSPGLAYATGLPLVHRRPPLGRDDRLALRRVARLTWRFFDELVGPEDHFLVPDNYQEDRRELVAHRTSPTNIGLQLLATLSAYDFGYLTLAGTLDRLERTFDTLLRMQRYRGHFYNWYDTRTLAPLAPAYISTVDSGNLAGYLLTLRSGLAQIADEAPIVDARILRGLRDALELCVSEIEKLSGGRLPRSLRAEVASLRTQLDERPQSLADWRALVAQLSDRLSAVSVGLHEIEEPLLAGGTGSAPSAVGEAEYWLERAASVIAEWQDELDRLAGWTPGAPVADAGVPSLPELIAWTDGAAERSNGPASLELKGAVERSRRYAEELIDRAERIGVLADDLIEEIEFGFLYSPERQLFSIGFSVTDGRLDGSFYDILASEARLASFMAIATGTISRDHWFKLGRSITLSGRLRTLLSWSASMFEYLMPLLVMRSYPSTLLDETYEAVVRRHIEYGAQRGVPWGISECAYNAQDLEGNYQYRAFGVPGLGLKRGLAEDLVVAPYASVLAAPIAPTDVVANLDRLRAEGMTGRYGLYEAIDYTPERLLPGKTGGVVLPTYMAHHQGMSLLALDNLLNGSPMQNRFHADPRIQAAELLLQERVPPLVPLKDVPVESADHVPSTRRMPALSVRRYVTPHTLTPRTHLLSNGSYTVMVTNAGGGYSRRQNLALTRWREDMTTDAWGTFCYVRNAETGDFWSTAHQPVGREAEDYEVTFALDRAVWRRLDAGLETRTEVVVSPEDDTELRRVSITNHTHRPQTVELTSYAEVVLAPAEADLAHPAFSNLFVETIAVPDRDALIATRRPREGTERPYLIHVLSGRGRVGPATRYETDRARFIGRGRTLARPAGIIEPGVLSNTTGPVLDPILSLRQAIRLPPGGTARLSFTTAFADNEAGARRLIEKYHDRRAVARALALASTHSQIELRHLGLTLEDAMRFQRFASRMLYGDPRLREPDAVHQNRRGQPELWKYGISGDMPIVLATITDAVEVPLFSGLLKAHEYLRGKGLLFDLVVLNNHAASYRQDLQDTLQDLLKSGPEQGWTDKPGGVFLRRGDLMPPEDRLLFRAVARVVMDGANGDLQQQLVRPQVPFEALPSALEVVRPRPGAPSPAGDQTSAPPQPGLEFFNGVGGFADDGREYVVHVHGRAGALPLAPWANVVGHDQFGFVATELGPGFTWSENSRMNRLTPWQNDPVCDCPGEAMYLCDQDTGHIWSATPLPAGDGRPFTIRHGQGFTAYEHTRDEIDSNLRLFVPSRDPVKIFQLAVRNGSRRVRRLSITLYVDWALGEDRTRSRLHVVTSVEPATGALVASNAFREMFASRLAFVDLSSMESRSVTGDRTEFIGRNGTLTSPAALGRMGLSGQTGAALDPCGAVLVQVTLKPGEERTVIGQLGEASDFAEVRRLVEHWRDLRAVDRAFTGVREFWDTLLQTVEIRTPDRSLDLMVNRWALYQTLVCRIWGRSGFYQSSGAFGFRDQLQDVLALLFAAPVIVRRHLLHAASRQFVEGDVQHWWHEPGGQGVRTRFADDRLWLVFSTLEYVGATGDDAVLDEEMPFLEGRPLNPDEHETYEKPAVSHQRGSLYEHCVRAVEISLSTGAHGLPLMGSGDWNDGMNLVGIGGRGESVWLAWFLISILPRFADVAERRRDNDRASSYRAHAGRLRQAVERAWDGQWYRRAYFDDETPLGSSSNEECRIDSIAQSWAVLAGGSDAARVRSAMESVDKQLIRRDDRLILLLAPPFDRMSPSPGYIQGYPPGIRENGGQYTHAALWTVLAFARMGDGARAAELLHMMNPIARSQKVEDARRYRVEPFVIPADVYSRSPHTGRGGWTWYTGSAGWMYRVGVEAIAGLSLRRGAIRIDPCIPPTWPRFHIVYRAPHAEYRIVVDNPRGVSRGVQRVELDGVEVPEKEITLATDGRVHQVRVILG